MVGEVGDRDALDLDPEPERRVGVAHPARPHLGAVQREVVVGDGLERDVAAQLFGGDREVRRAHDAAEHLVERAVVLVRADDGDRAATGGERREERQALDVVPVEVREQHGRPVAVEAALGVQLLAVVAQAGAEVEDDGSMTVGRDLDARGVPPVAVELVAVARSGPANPPEVHCVTRDTSTRLPRRPRDSTQDTRRLNPLMPSQVNSAENPMSAP